MNSIGKILKITIYGSSHGEELGILIDGCPVGIRLYEEDFIEDIEKRKPKTNINTKRIENDSILIKSGVYKNFTDGTPMFISFKNENIKGEDYNFIKSGLFRPGTADFTANKKYKGFNNPNGGGMFSGRMTLAIVAAGVVAKKIIPEIIISSEVEFLINHEGEKFNLKDLTKNEETIKTTLGGSICCRVNNVPVGLGEPFFDSIESVISHAIFSIPGASAISFGSNSYQNDCIIDQTGKTKTNCRAGINGGISNGNEIYFYVRFRPPASTYMQQEGYNFKTKKIENFTIKGRHDICYITRTPIIVEAMTAITFADLFLQQKIFI